MYEVKSEEDFENQIGYPLTIAVFSSNGCVPCEMLHELIDTKLASAFGARIHFIGINIDDIPALEQRFGIKATPATLFFSKKHKLVFRKDEDRVIGFNARIEQIFTNVAAKLKI